MKQKASQFKLMNEARVTAPRRTLSVPRAFKFVRHRHNWLEIPALDAVGASLIAQVPSSNQKALYDAKVKSTIGSVGRNVIDGLLVERRKRHSRKTGRLDLRWFK